MASGQAASPDPLAQSLLPSRRPIPLHLRLHLPGRQSPQRCSQGSARLSLCAITQVSRAVLYMLELITAYLFTLCRIDFIVKIFADCLVQRVVGLGPDWLRTREFKALIIRSALSSPRLEKQKEDDSRQARDHNDISPQHYPPLNASCQSRLPQLSRRMNTVLHGSNGHLVPPSSQPLRCSAVRNVVATVGWKLANRKG